jgi:hypothetical protein
MSEAASADAPAGRSATRKLREAQGKLDAQECREVQQRSLACQMTNSASRLEVRRPTVRPAAGGRRCCRATHVGRSGL